MICHTSFVVSYKLLISVNFTAHIITFTLPRAYGVWRGGDGWGYGVWLEVIMFHLVHDSGFRYSVIVTPSLRDSDFVSAEYRENAFMKLD